MLQEERRGDRGRGVVVRPLSHEAVQGEGLEGDLVGRRLYLLCCQSGAARLILLRVRRSTCRRISIVFVALALFIERYKGSIIRWGNIALFC